MSTTAPPLDEKAQRFMGQPAVLAARAVPALDAVCRPVDAILEAFLAARVTALAAVDPALEGIASQVAAFVAGGGKRLRPAFVYWGHRAAGADHDDAVLKSAAAVELLHNFALIHDDVMDRSAERRGRPTVHESMRAAHTADGLVGDPGWFGVGAAILAGDLTFVWADELFEDAALPPEVLRHARRVFTELRVEVMAGQYLDLRLAGHPAAGVDDALRVALLKSGRYTVTRPLQLGAALGRADGRTTATLSAYGDAVGVAFQLRDDVLGLFGDPATTGKGVLDDLREGKRTVLMLSALELASPADQRTLAGVLGREDVDQSDAEQVRDIVCRSGALEAVEGLLASRQRTARDALAPLPVPARDALAELAELAAFRVV